MKNTYQASDRREKVVIAAREAAFKVLGECRRKKMRPEESFSALVEKAGMSERDIALSMQILYGTIQNMSYCDFIISQYSSLKIKKLEPRLLDILRLSVYQILFLAGIPHSAAVNEGVALAKKYANPRAAGFANALLRKITDDAAIGSLPEIPSENEYQYLSVKYSHPEWLVREFCDRIGAGGAGELLRANNANNLPITAQVNTLLTDSITVMSSLAADGVDASYHKWLKDCIELRNPGNIERLNVFINGCLYVQDAASRLAVSAADPKPGQFVIDGCAAPGGKSFAAAIMMKNSGRIAAFDISDEKLTNIRDGSARLGLGIVDAMNINAAEQSDMFLDRADVVLADVPCSNFGVIRKKPDVRNKAQQDIAFLPDMQLGILANLSKYVKPGGTLLYSTCTLLQRENENVIEAFLSGHPEFSAEGFLLPGIGCVPDGMITLWPHIHGTDGFFICKLIRKGWGSGRSQL